MTEPTTDQQPTTQDSREPWTFTRRDGEPFTLADAVYQAIGGASSCWEHLRRAGVFDSTRAKEIGDALLAEIRSYGAACRWCTGSPVFDDPAALLEHVHQVHPSADTVEARAKLAIVIGERDERLTLAESSRLARRYDDAEYDRDREHAKALAYLQRGDHLAALLSTLADAAGRQPAALSALVEAAEAARVALAADPEKTYGRDIPPARTPGEHVLPADQRARRSRRRHRAPERPTLCRTVRYVGKHGIHAVRAAVVTCTVDELDPAGDAPALESEMHVHLFVTTPSLTGFFVEFNVPHDAAGGPGTWHWPPRESGSIAGALAAGPATLHVHQPQETRIVPVPVDPRTGRMGTW